MVVEPSPRAGGASGSAELHYSRIRSVQLDLVVYINSNMKQEVYTANHMKRMLLYKMTIEQRLLWQSIPNNYIITINCLPKIELIN